MKLLNRKVWLEPDGSYILTLLERGSYGTAATLKLSDGNNIVNYWLDISSKKEKRATINQLHKMSDEIEELASALEGLDNG